MMVDVGAVDPPLERVVARSILKGLRPQLDWDAASEQTRNLCLVAAREAVSAVRFVDGLRAAGGRLEGDLAPGDEQ